MLSQGVLVRSFYISTLTFLLYRQHRSPASSHRFDFSSRDALFVSHTFTDTIYSGPEFCHGQGPKTVPPLGQNNQTNRGPPPFYCLVKDPWSIFLGHPQGVEVAFQIYPREGEGGLHFKCTGPVSSLPACSSVRSQVPRGHPRALGPPPPPPRPPGPLDPLRHRPQHRPLTPGQGPPWGRGHPPGRGGISFTEGFF